MMPAEGTSPLAEAAHRYADLGIHLIPLIERGKRPAFVTGKNHERAANDTERVDRWWHNDPDRNIGAACTANRWCVIDIDGPEGWNTLASLEGDYGELPQTWTQVTGREDGAGQHFIFAWPTDAPIPTKQLGPGLETRSHGAQIVLAPSIHPSGRTYQWQVAPWEMPIATLPHWVAELCEKPTRPDSAPISHIRPLDPNTSEDLAYKRLQGLAETVAHSPEGERNKHLNHAAYTAGRLVEHGVRPDDIQSRLTDAGRIAGLHESEIRNTIRSGLNAGIADGPDPEHGLQTISHPVQLPPRVDPQTGEIIEQTQPVTGINLLNLTEVLTGHFADEQWLVEPLIPKGRQVSLYAQGKTGKSLVILDIVASLATGRPILGREAQEPIDILYIDFEMTPSDLQERLLDLGYTADDPDHHLLVQHLHYAQLQPFFPFDTRAGGDQLEQLIEQTSAELVVIDTLIRSLEGEENSSDTIKDFNRYTGQRLKARGVTLVRVDHAGKDVSKGARGTSAKRDDVDLVWRLRAEVGKLDGGETLRFINDASRMSWVPQNVIVTRLEGPLRHELERRQISEAGAEAWRALKDLDAPATVSNRDAQKMLRDAGHTLRNDAIAEAVRWMKREAK